MFPWKKFSEQQIYDYIEANQERFYRLAYSYTRNKEDALDVVQDATYKALINMKSVKDPRYLKTWFYRILVNCALDLARRKKTAHSYFNTYSNETPTGTQTQDYLDLYEALLELDENHKTVIILRYFEDMKLDEIAEITNTNLSTVKTRLYAGLKKLRIELEETEIG